MFLNCNILKNVLVSKINFLPRPECPIILRREGIEKIL
jgi:hypothetical protein